MNWINKEADIYFCSNCEATIRVPNGEELPCYCKSCEMEYSEEGYDISYDEYCTLKERVESEGDT